MTIKALSVRQPWAWAIVAGVKTIENRSRRTSYRGKLLIHAGVSKSDLGEEGDRMLGLPSYDKLTYGAIVGVAELVDCVPVEQVAGQPFAEGPYCWLMVNARPLAVPYPCRGALSLWSPPAAFRLPT
jgi:ASCH domain-containing protein